MARRRNPLWQGAKKALYRLIERLEHRCRIGFFIDPPPTPPRYLSEQLECRVLLSKVAAGSSVGESSFTTPRYFQTPTTTTTYTLGADFNTDATSATWAQEVSGGRSFLIIKAAQGDNPNSFLPSNISSAPGISSSFTFGLYGFADPDEYANPASMVTNPSNSAAVEADAEAAADSFYHIAQPYLTTGHLFPALDLEDESGHGGFNSPYDAISGYPKWTWSEIADWASAWAYRLRQDDSAISAPILYMTQGYAQNLAPQLINSFFSPGVTFSLWVADINRSPGVDPTPSIGAWPTWSIEQYDQNEPTPPGDLDALNPATTLASLEITGSESRLPAPTLSAPQNGVTGVLTTPQFIWSQVVGNQGYRLVVSSNSGDLTNDPTLIGNTNPANGFNQQLAPNTTTYTWSGALSGNTIYYWEVHALGTDLATAGIWSPINSFTTNSPTLDAPTLSSPPNGGANIASPVTFSWSAVAGNPAYYWLVVTTNPSDLPSDPNSNAAGPSAVLLQRINAPTTQYQYDFAPATTYYWELNARDSSGNGGPWSQVENFTTNSLPTVTVTAIDPDATWGTTDYGTFRLTRTGSTGSSLSLSATLISGTAVYGTDYDTFSPLSIPAGSASLDWTVIPIISTDTTMDRTVTVQVNTTTPNYNAGNPNTATVTIHLASSDSAVGTTGPDSIVLRRDTISQRIDWMLNGATPAFALNVNDPNGLTINGGGGNDALTLDNSNGNALPNTLHLNGNFAVNGLQGSNPLANTTLEIGRSTVYFSYVTSSDPIAIIRQYLEIGSSGAWNGTPTANTGVITSFAAAANAAQTTAVGYADSADGLIAGQPANTIELKYTLYGDTTLSGTVGFNDFTRLTQHYNQSTGGTWDTGDFNYDGSVNFSDFTLMTRTYNTSLGSQAVPALAAAASVAAASTQQSAATPSKSPRPNMTMVPTVQVKPSESAQAVHQPSRKHSKRYR